MNKHRLIRSLGGFFLPLVIVVVLSCSPRSSSEIDWQAFSGRRAYAQVEKLVSYGPRPSASSSLIRAATYIATQLQEYGYDVEEQVFVAQTPRGPVQFRNIIGKSRVRRGATGRVIVMGSHYDTKWMPDINFVGANDGGSSTGVLLEMARVASTTPDLWFVFFDGEECMKSYGENDGLWGSRYFVKEAKATKQFGSIKAMILLDMVGDANLNIVMPANSHRGLVQRVFDAARETGNREKFAFSEAMIVDDHVPFVETGVPSVDLIDFEYGSAPGKNDYWHTDKDTLDKLSPRSLQIVGQTVLRLVDELGRKRKL